MAKKKIRRKGAKRASSSGALARIHEARKVFDREVRRAEKALHIDHEAAVETLLSIREAIAGAGREVPKLPGRLYEGIREMVGSSTSAKGKRGPGKKKGKGKKGKAGANAGMTTAEAVMKAIKDNGGTASGQEIRKAFASANDKRTLNFTILKKQGFIKANGTAEKAKGGKGRAGALFVVAGKKS